MKPRFLKLSYFGWLVIPVGMWLTFDLLGLPHVISSYAWVDEGQGMDPFAKRSYTLCRFVGPYGQFERPATHGRCTWVRFFQEQDS